MHLLRHLIPAMSIACCFSTAHAEVITTTFSSNANYSGNMFDVVTLAGPLTVTGFDLNLNTGTWTIEVYKKSGTWATAANNVPAWTLLDRESLTSAGPKKPTFFDVADFTLDGAATTGLYITTTNVGANMLYSEGTGVGNIAASNADLQILQGAAKGYGVSGTTTPRIWNGSIYYEQASSPARVPEPASLLLLGAGLAGVAFSRKTKKG